MDDKYLSKINTQKILFANFTVMVGATQPVSKTWTNHINRKLRERNYKC